MRSKFRGTGLMLWIGVPVFLFASFAISGCASQQYNIRVKSEYGVPEAGALVVVSEGSKLPAKALLYMAWGSIRGLFTGEDYLAWMRRSTKYPPVMAGITDNTGMAEIKYPRTNIHISSINTNLTHVWISSKPIKRWSKSVDYVLTSDDIRTDARQWRQVIHAYLEQALKFQENQQPEIIEYKNRLEKLLEHQAAGVE